MKAIEVDSYGLVKKMEWGKPVFEKSNIHFGIRIKNKRRVLAYLKAFEPVWQTSQSVTDVVSNNKVFKADHLYTDGVYDWSKGDIYHFEKYDMELNDEFIQYVLNKKTT